ncbi:MAG: carboxypeptidase-like regulatory domain-containing protein, partial [Anaerolineaceae bacterium]
VQHYHIQASKQSTFTSLDIDEYTLDASTTFTTLFNLTGNRTYYWRVRAFNSVGDYGPWSSVRTLKILPDKVASAWMYEALESPNYSLTLQPGFHWTDPACTGKYLIQIYKSIPSHPLVKSATVTTGTVCEGDYLLTTSLGLNTLYEWRISVQGVTGTSLPVINTFTTPGVVPGTPVLLGPANNEAIPDATYPNWQPNFTWQQVTSGSPEGYEIQIASQPGFGSSILIDKQIHNATNHNYQLGDALAYNASVYWRVRACQESCSVWSAARKLVTRPGTPTNLNETGYHNGEGTATLDTIFQWSDPGTYPNSAKSYSLAIYSNTACTTLWKTLTSTTTSVDVLLNPGVNYCVKVRGVGPTASITGAYSAPGTFTSMSPPAVPTLLLPANKAVISSSVGGSEPYQVNFSWKASPPPVPGATVSYYLQVSDKPDFTSNWVNDSGVPGPSSTKSFHAGTYYWRVSAWDSVGSYAYSMWSAARSFSTPAQINVRVTTEGNGPLANASVAVSGVSTPATTDSNGNCYIANVSSGAHTITVSLANRMTQTRTVTIANGKVYFEPFALPPVSLTLGVIRVVLTWDPDNGRSLEGNLWLPLIPTPFHLVYPNTGKNDLNSFPNAYESVYQPADGIEAIDLMPVAGNYVFGVNQVVPASGSWSGAGAKVEVYRSTGASLTLLKTCLQPSGSGRWWYAANMTLWGAIPSVTCMNSLRAAAPAPYNDNPITGHVYANLSRHPLSGVWISYDTGAAITDQNGFYSIPASAGASYTLTPETYGVLSFSPTNSAAAAGATGVDFTATPAASLSPGRLYAEAIQGDYAYLGANGWLYIVNIHNKAGPVEASRLWIDGTNIQDIVVAGHYAYLASASETGGEVNVVDVSNPANPVWVSSEPVLADNLAVYGQYLVMASSRYLYIYQQATSPAPHFLTRLVTLDPGSVNAAYWVAVSGHYAYVTGSQGLYIYDITNPAHPSAPWHYPAFWGYYTLVVDGQYAYLGYDDGDML